MATPTGANLLRLSETQLGLANPDEDIRGRRVVDRDGKDIGKIEALLIDDQERKVRFLQVVSGGFLHIGRSRLLIPVDVIQSITPDKVQIDRTREHVAGAPPYDPVITEDPDWQAYYAYYGAAPFWAPGYMYPMYPYF
ncbi:MAG: PRC-barrel domain-containing protein [Phycisphaerales bacterium]|nr:PRC-barrel domain-containing protein [Phycisphaerales bacterium]